MNYLREVFKLAKYLENEKEIKLRTVKAHYLQKINNKLQSKLSDSCMKCIRRIFDGP